MDQHQDPELDLEPHSLEQELMQGLRDTGMYEMASDLLIVQDGTLPEVRMHEQWQSGFGNPEAGLPRSAFDARQGSSSLAEGQQLVDEADRVAEVALTASAEVAARLEAALNRPGSVGANESTPTRQRRRRCRVWHAPQSDLAHSKGAKAACGSRSFALAAGEDAGLASGRGGSRGLRHFSMKVCEKVESKQRTTYNEVADELVNELPHTNTSTGTARQYDEKNIRRRVYDALNVLMAMDIITRQKKDIVWKGLPHNQVTHLERMRADHARLVAHVQKQKSYIQELHKQQAAYRGLLQRNSEQQLPSLRAGADGSMPTALPLPFVLIQVDPGAVVEIQISADSKVAQFDFRSTPFRMIGDEDVLYGLHLHETVPSAADAKAAAAAEQASLARADSDAAAQQLLAMSAGQLEAATHNGRPRSSKRTASARRAAAAADGQAALLAAEQHQLQPGLYAHADGHPQNGGQLGRAPALTDGLAEGENGILPHWPAPSYLQSVAHRNFLYS